MTSKTAIAQAANGYATDFRKSLIGWYRENARDLPWRRTQDPYAIWISEVMLQQTRVAAVIDYYQRFLAAFPTIEALAAAPEPSVLALWSGLGYYRRARMLHRAAQVLVADYGAQMPATAAGLRELPGIGEYTSAAIASISFGEAVPVLDGNVERVLLRLRGESAVADHPNAATRKTLREAAQQLLDPKHPDEFNQAMMELGAVICLPRGPRCGDCPVRSFCRTQGEHPTAPALRMKSQKVAYGLLERTTGGQAAILLVQRPAHASQMPGMWELPALDPGIVPAIAPTLLSQETELIRLRHSITNTNYEVAVYALGRGGQKLVSASKSSLHWVSLSDLWSLPLTGLARKVLRRLKVAPVEADSVPAVGKRARAAGKQQKSAG